MILKKNIGAIFALLLIVQQVTATDPGLKFLENKNQWPKGIDFSTKVPGGRMYVCPTGFSFYLRDENKMDALHESSHHHFDEASGERVGTEEFIDAHFTRLKFVGANVVTPTSTGKYPEYYNFFIGNDPSRWASHVNAYSKIQYAGIYPGIDLQVYSSGNDIKYDYVVSPGADPTRIQVEYAGFDQICLQDGNLISSTSVGVLEETKPIAYQLINGEKIIVPCSYRLTGHTVSYIFPEGYDDCFELIIDPLLIFSTYSGSTADNWGSTATPGENGNLYSAGVTSLGANEEFPATNGAFQESYGGLYDIGILKYDSTGMQLLYASYLGGSDSESPHSLVVDSDGNLLVLGTTSSSNFPTTPDAIDKTFNGGTAVYHVVNYTFGSDLFITKIKQDGDALLGSTFLGGSQNDGLNPQVAGQLVRNYGDQLRGDIITDAVGDIYISTVTASTNFPVANSFGLVYNGGVTDALVMKLNSTLSTVHWAAFLGGNGADASHTIKLDQHGDIVVAGGTSSINFPTTTGVFQEIHAGGVDGWMARIKNDGLDITHSTFTGTGNYDQVYFLDLNSNDEVYVYGQTDGSMPVTPGVYSNANSGQFLQKFSGDLSTQLFATVFGSSRGIPDISPTAFLVNECNNIYMSGWGGVVNIESGFWQNGTLNMPTTFDAYQRTSSGSDFYFMVLTADASRFLYGTYLGGTSSRTHVDGGTSRFDKGGIVYHAVCSGCAAYNATDGPTSDFPTTVGAWSRTNNSANCNNAAFKFDLSSLKAILQTNSVQLDNPGFNKVCIPEEIVFENLCIGGEMFEWDLGDGTRITRFDKNSITHAYQNPGRYTVKLRAIDQGTCKSRDSTSTVIDVFLANINVQEDDVICEGTAYTLQADGGIDYAWWNTDSTFTSGIRTPRVEPKDTTRYFVKITDANGCVVKDTVDLGVIPGFEIDFEVERENNCQDPSTVLIVNNTEWDGTGTLEIDYGDGTRSSSFDEPHRYENEGVYQIKQIGTREFCIYEKAVSVPVFPIKVPNIITPGSAEGMNDYFTVQYGSDPTKTPGDYGIKVSLYVYNRWGREVYASNDYQYDWKATGLASGVYYIELTLENYPTCKNWLQVVN